MSTFELPPIQARAYVAVPPERVYALLTDATGWDAWFTQGTEVDARPGGSIRFRWVDFGADRVTSQDGGPVLEATPAQRFSFQWTPGESITTVAFDLEPRGPGTLVTVTESGYSTSERDLEAMVECAVGWGEALALLKIYLEHGLTYGPVPGEEGVESEP